MDNNLYRNTFSENGYDFEDKDFDILCDRDGLGDFFDIFSDFFQSSYLSFDGECIDSKDAYKCLLESFLAMSNGQITIKRITSTFDDPLNVERLKFELGERQFDWNFSHDTDWVSEIFMQNVCELMAIGGLGKLLFDANSDVCTAIYVPTKLADFINQYTGSDTSKIVSDTLEHYSLPKSNEEYNLKNMLDELCVLTSNLIDGDILSIQFSLELYNGILGVDGSIEYVQHGKDNKNISLTNLPIHENLFVGIYVALVNEKGLTEYNVEFDWISGSYSNIKIVAEGRKWKDLGHLGMSIDSFIEKNGEFTAQDLGLDDLSLTAEEGDLDAQLKLGHYYEKGIGIELDLMKAVKWYLAAAKQKHAEAAYFVSKLACSIELSKCDRDIELSKEMLLKSATLGWVVAQTQLGTNFLNGRGGFEKDIKKSLKWYTLAAEHNNEIAQYGLALLHAPKSENFSGKDMSLGYAWAKVSDNNGFFLAGTLVTTISKDLTEKQLEVGNKLASSMIKKYSLSD